MKPAARKKVEESKALDISNETVLKTADSLKIDLNMVRSVFQRAVSTAHNNLDKLWIGYEQFEKSLGNSQLAEKFLGEYMPRYGRAKAAFKELQELCRGMELAAIAVPITAKNAKEQGKALDRWRKIVTYERTNPIRLEKDALQARVSLVYQQACLTLSYHAEIWYEFSSYLDLAGHAEKATDLLVQAVERFLSTDIPLRLVIAHRHELAEVPPKPESLKAAEDVYKALLSESAKACPLVLMNLLSFVRRQRGAHDFRDAFIEATVSSPHCTWEVYTFVALTEWHVFGSADAAAKTFRLGLERFGEREPSLLASYLNFLIGSNDLKTARSEFSRGVLDRLQAGVRDQIANRTDPLVRDSLTFLWQKWVRLERYFGDAGAVRRTVAFRDEEFRNLQRDQDVDEEAISDTPAALGLASTLAEVEESFRFQHLMPRSARIGHFLEAPVSAATAAGGSDIRDQAIVEASEEQKKLASVKPGMSVHIARPDVTKMLSFRPALDVVGRKRPGEADASDMQQQLPCLIPKCLQDLLAILPNRPLRGSKPDVDYLLTVLQTTAFPPMPLKEFDNFRYDNARKEENSMRRRDALRDDDEDQRFFSSKPTIYRERLHAKRQKVLVEQDQRTKAEASS
eukprot:gnl/TRDRNA2_/TRDRNA2_167938_c0_seq1.p1 gnl/TRDRNA2_/TRDRNA2_167938_c0~~gnl/TRDRNA2_/TRDRNA2_167938_c0_seq1.p1  ORF type:complete len:627 (+),score=138.90 gnl/TRDRNA2_/TRDRNA2_167938_c0_seq1:196-2076(+)